MRSVLYYFVKKSGCMITTPLVRGYPRIRAMPIEKRHTPCPKGYGFLEVNKGKPVSVIKGRVFKNFFTLAEEMREEINYIIIIIIIIIII